MKSRIGETNRRKRSFRPASDSERDADRQRQGHGGRDEHQRLDHLRPQAEEADDGQARRDEERGSPGHEGEPESGRQANDRDPAEVIEDEGQGHAQGVDACPDRAEDVQEDGVDRAVGVDPVTDAVEGLEDGGVVVMGERPCALERDVQDRHDERQDADPGRGRKLDPGSAQEADGRRGHGAYPAGADGAGAAPGCLVRTADGLQDVGPIDEADELPVLDDADRLLGRGGGMDREADYRGGGELRPVHGIIRVPADA